MVRQYGYTLQVLRVTEGGRDENGDYIPVTSEFVDHSKCRDEANTGGKSVTLDDGSALVYDVLVQLPKGTLPIESNTTIRVMEGSTVRVSGTVKGFRKDQLHCRLWV